MQIPTFLKWAGGKRKLLSTIDEHLPEEINKYYEPFLGGSSVFFYIKQKYNPNFCMISDINKDLIDAYINVRDNPKRLIQHLRYFKKNNCEKFYYQIRKLFNENKIRRINRSAAFIYLNKTCFNGLYRVNSKNEFNVPYGKHKNPEIFDRDTILFASKLLQGVKIICQDYEELKNYVNKGDFVYLDPCYDTEKKTTFANYTPKRFTKEDNERLALFVAELKRRKVSVLLSDSPTEDNKKFYHSNKFIIIELFCTRSINCNPEGRGPVKELLIKNYRR